MWNALLTRRTVSCLSGAALRVWLCLQLPGLWRLCGSLLLAQSCFMLRSSGVGQSVLLTDVSAFPQRRCRAESVHCPRGPRAPPLHCSLLSFSFPHPFPSLLALSFLEGAVLGVISMHAAFQSGLTCPLASCSQGSPSPMAT